MNQLMKVLSVSAVAVTTLVGVQQLGVQKAFAVDPYAVTFTGTTASAGVNVRTGPGTNYPVVYTKAGSQSVTFSGLEYGTIEKDNWYGNDDPRWYYFVEGGQKRYIASAVIAGNPPSSAIRPKDRAIAWAIKQEGSTSYDGYCERFVEYAYGTSGQYYSAATASSALNTHGSLSTAPIGALVFFNNVSLGHVGIYIGQNTMVSGLSTVKSDNILTESYWNTYYTGWGKAPTSWPGHS